MYEYSLDFLVAVHNPCTAIKGTKKSNVFPAHATNACRIAQVYLHSFFNCALDDGIWLNLRSAYFPLGGRGEDTAIVNVMEN